MTHGRGYPRQLARRSTDPNPERLHGCCRDTEVKGERVLTALTRYSDVAVRTGAGTDSRLRAAVPSLSSGTRDSIVMRRAASS